MRSLRSMQCLFQASFFGGGGIPPPLKNYNFPLQQRRRQSPASRGAKRVRGGHMANVEPRRRRGSRRRRRRGVGNREGVSPCPAD